MIVDGAKGIPVVQSYAPLDFDIVNHFKNNGMKVVEIEVGTSPSPSPFILRNCVGMVKAMCCIRSFAVTPYQLYKHLEQRSIRFTLTNLFNIARLPGGGIFSTPTPPPLPDPPPPPPEPAKKSAPEVTRARDEERKRVTSLAGDKSTVLTSPRGLLATDQANTGKTLLGG